MAVLIIGMLTVGLIMTDMPLSPDKIQLYGLHKSFGLTILGLVFLRLSWRLTSITPPLPGHMGTLQRVTAHASHLALYGLMVAMPLTGWLMSSSSGFPVSWFGLFQAPDLVSPDKSLQPILKGMHTVGAYLFIGLIAIHIMAALYHHLICKDSILTRMIKSR